MGVITKDTFDPSRAFSNVRFQTGVPLVDADVNELDDIRKYDVRAALGWLVGDGVPDGNDGFRIEALATPAPDDFQIGVGAQSAAAAPGDLDPALRNFGRCIVDGRDVFLQTGTTYKDQPNFTAASVQPIPSAAGPVLVYIDVWERLVTPSEDPSLVVRPLDTETCARLKREWVVRTREGANVPAPGDPDFEPNHGYYGIASIQVRMEGGSPAPIRQGDITDLRERRLGMVPSTLITDALGVTASDCRRGLNRPVISLREAINALLRDELPGTALQELQSIAEPHDDYLPYGITFDPTGHGVAVWRGERGDGAAQILGGRWDPTEPGANFTDITQITAPVRQMSVGNPHAVVLPTGDILFAYHRRAAAAAPADVFFRRASDLSSLAAAPETSATTDRTSANFNPSAVVVPASGGGGHVVFFWSVETPGGTMWRFRRRLYDPSWREETAAWADTSDVALSTLPGGSLPNPRLAPFGVFHAIAAPDGNVWASFSTTNTGATPATVGLVRLTAATGATTTPSLVGVFATSPFVQIDGAGVVWLFCATGSGIFAQQFTGAATPLGPAALVPGTAAPQTIFPSAAVDRRGGVWLFWVSLAGGLQQIVTTRWNPPTGSWGPVQPVTMPGVVQSAIVTRDPAGALWLFGWRNGPFNTVRLLFRAIYPQI